MKMPDFLYKKYVDDSNNGVNQGSNPDDRAGFSAFHNKADHKKIKAKLKRGKKIINRHIILPDFKKIITVYLGNQR